MLLLGNWPACLNRAEKVGEPAGPDGGSVLSCHMRNMCSSAAPPFKPFSGQSMAFSLFDCNRISIIVEISYLSVNNKKNGQPSSTFSAQAQSRPPLGATVLSHLHPLTPTTVLLQTMPAADTHPWTMASTANHPRQVGHCLDALSGAQWSSSAASLVHTKGLEWEES